MKKGCIVFLALILCMSGWRLAEADDPPPAGGRLVQLTLIPDYGTGTIRFDGKATYADGSPAPVDLTGLPLDVEAAWMDDTGNTWYVVGTMRNGEILRDSENGTYRLLIEPVALQPRDELRFTFPFVNLDYGEIGPSPDPPDRSDAVWRGFTHRFTFKAGEDRRDIPSLVVPFAPVEKQIDLVLTPLMGEVLVGKSAGLRLSGRVVFESLEDYGEFTRGCQSTSNRLNYGDYRVAHLLSSLDRPHFSGFASINPSYQFKPTEVGLRSELLACQYDQEEGVGRVEALFSGRVFHRDRSQESLPPPLQGTDSPDGIYPFDPDPVTPFKGAEGYEIRLGRIALAPDDVLTVSVPHARIQSDVLAPPPTTLLYPTSKQTAQGDRIVYRGPKTFDLSVKYVPRSQLLFSQFPAVLRPTMELVEVRFGGLFGEDGSPATWAILAAALALLVASLSINAGKRWLRALAWFLGSVGLLYGIRGYFGLLVIALAMYLGRSIPAQLTSPAARSVVRELAAGLAIGILIAVAIILDGRAIALFRDLSTSQLSPVTPMILGGAAAAILILLYGWRRDLAQVTASDVPALAFLLLILCTYDVFDKSLLALLVVALGGVYGLRRLSQVAKQGGTNPGSQFGKRLRDRLHLAFVSRKGIVPLSILLLIIFAVGNDLTTTYANELYVDVPWPAAPLLVPLLVFASVALTLAAIALLFVLLYPVIPFEAGYAKAVLFALFLYAVFLFGVATDDRLISTLPSLLVGRVIYYFSVPMLVGLYFDVHDFTQESAEELAEEMSFQAAAREYLKRLQGIAGTLGGILSLLAPSVYTLVASDPVITTYFGLLEHLLLLPV